MEISLEYIIEGIRSALIYFPNTLRLVFTALLVGIIIGTLFALARFYKVPVIGKLIAVFVTIYQGIPIVVALLIYHLLFINYLGGFLSFWHISKEVSEVNTIYIGIFALSLSEICGASEVIRGALQSIDKGQEEAGFSIGLTGFQVIKRIVLPQIIPVAIPPLTNSVIGLIKASSIVSVVGIVEVTQGALLPSALTYSYFEGYLAAAAVYWIFSVFVELFMKALSSRAGRYRKAIEV